MTKPIFELQPTICCKRTFCFPVCNPKI